MRDKREQYRAFGYFALGFIVAMLTMLIAPVFATDDHHYTPPKVVVIEKHDHDAVAVLIGAGITYWLMRRHERRQREPRPLVIVPADRSDECSATVERVIAACGVSK